MNAILGPRTALALSLVSLVWCASLLTNFHFDLLGADKFGMIFNDMAQRLLHGDMTIDPVLIDFEAFVRDGNTYTYFGVFPAVLRVPAVLAGLAAYPMARISSLVALFILSFASIRMTQHVLAIVTGGGANRTIAAASVVGVSFSGPIIYTLAAASMYHEVIYWAAAGTAVFNWIVVRRVAAPGGLRGGDFALLALTAGCVLLTRVSCGVALYAGLGLLLAWPCVMAVADGGISAALNTFVRAIRAASPAIVIALLFLLAEGAVNQSRWGDPFTPIPLRYYLGVIHSPHRDELLTSLALHGPLDVRRIPLAALYYATGVKLEPLLPAFVAEHFYSIEGPRVIAPLCVPWMLACAILGLRAVFSPPWRRSALAPLTIANGIGFLLILSVPWLSLRYTFDGWGFMTLTASVGAGWLAQLPPEVPDPRRPHRLRVGRLAISFTALGIAVSHATLLRYKINNFATEPMTRYTLSRHIQPLLCPDATLNPDVKLSDFIPLVTLHCPPLW